MHADVRLNESFRATLGLAAVPASALTVDEVIARHVEARGGADRWQAIRTLRRTLGEDAEHPFIRTVSRHGYRFVCPVVEETDDGADSPTPAATR